MIPARLKNEGQNVRLARNSRPRQAFGARSALRSEADLTRREADTVAGSSVLAAGLPFCPSRGTMLSMRALTIALCLLATPALSFVAGCTSSAITPEAACLAHNVTPGTSAYADCVEIVREKGPSILHHSHIGGHQ